MEKAVVFGKCLNELLMARGWSAARLAREMNLDASYIRRWIRGDRVPSVKSDYVEQIADSLCTGLDGAGCKSLRNSYIVTLRELGMEIDDRLPFDTTLKDILSQSQIYSLKLTNEERMQKSATTEDDIVSLLEKLGRENRKNTQSQSMTGISDEISAMPFILKGRENILSSYIALVKAARNMSQIKRGDIIITFQSESHPFDGYPDYEGRWQSEIEDVLDEGWRIYHLLMLNKNISRSMKLVNRIVQRVGFNRQYYPYYFEKYGTIKPASEAIIVEGVGALICLSTEDPEYIDTAFYFSDLDAVQSLYKHYMQMFGLMKPLLKVYPLNDYFVFNTETDKNPGDRLIIRDDLDSMTMPYSLWYRYLDRYFNDKEELQPHIYRLNSRLNSFYKQVSRYRFMNICTVDSIEHLIKYSEYNYDNEYRIPTPEDIVEHLQNIIYLLKTYDNYEIGLLSENQINLLPPAFWEVKGDYSVIIDMWEPKEDRYSEEVSGLFLAITEGTITGSFREHFFDIWDKITPNYRDKEFVIRWFEERLQWYKKEHNIK